MTHEVFEQVRDIDHTVLTCIKNSKDDVRQIREATTLTHGKVTYSFKKLSNLGLITVERQNGTVEDVIDGQKRVYQAPKQASLTAEGEQYFEWIEREQEIDMYQDLSREELAERLRNHEDRIETLENAVDMLKQEFQRQS